MKADLTDYNYIKEFIKTQTKTGFKGIDKNDSDVIALNRILEINNQFCIVEDLIKPGSNWASGASFKLVGIEPEELRSYHMLEAAHPDDLQKYAIFRSKMFNQAFELYVIGKGETYMSINLRIRNPQGTYKELLIQFYLYYTSVPSKTVLLIQLQTDISAITKKKSVNHYYSGSDRTYFRFPDEDLLFTGNHLSIREMEVLKLISEGLNSEKIADKLFLSIHTVNTHRRNILSKCGKSHISNLIYDFSQCRVF
jgi:hypothetical protein